MNRQRLNRKSFHENDVNGRLSSKWQKLFWFLSADYYFVFITEKDQPGIQKAYLCIFLVTLADRYDINPSRRRKKMIFEEVAALETKNKLLALKNQLPLLYL